MALNMTEIIKRVVTGLLIIIALASTYFYAKSAFSVLIIILLIIVLITEWPPLVARSQALALLTPIYPVAPFLILIAINQSADRSLLLILFATVFAFDTGSYCAGKLFGRHKIAPRISPKKTWEGFLGGYLLSFCVLIALSYLFAMKISVIYLALYTFIISITALAGDLFESYLKRRVNLKDTGTLLPGHGGILDRFDSVLFVAYLFYILLKFR
jgi:phosphatidate cytidylyltransferase